MWAYFKLTCNVGRFYRYPLPTCTSLNHTMFELITNANVFAPYSLGTKHLLVCVEKIVHIADELSQLDSQLAVNVTDLEWCLAYQAR